MRERESKESEQQSTHRNMMPKPVVVRLKSDV